MAEDMTKTNRIRGWMAGWRPFEIGWLGVSLALTIALSVLVDDTPLGLLASAFGILCVVLTAKGVVWSYVFGIVNVLAYAAIAWRNGLYGEMGLNLFFFLPTSVAGFILWRRNIQREGRLAMKRLSAPAFAGLLALCGAGIAAMGFGLSLIDGQNTPYIDATTNVLSFAATFLMMARYREQWALYIILNVFTVAMWSIRLAAGSPDGLPMVAMWSAYLVNACYGYWNWSRGSRKE